MIRAHLLFFLIPALLLGMGGMEAREQYIKAAPKYIIKDKAEREWLAHYHGTEAIRFDEDSIQIHYKGKGWVDITNWRNKQVHNYGPRYYAYQCNTDTDCFEMCRSRGERNCE